MCTAHAEQVASDENANAKTTPAVRPRQPGASLHTQSSTDSPAPARQPWRLESGWWPNICGQEGAKGVRVMLKEPALQRYGAWCDNPTCGSASQCRPARPRARHAPGRAIFLRLNDGTHVAWRDVAHEVSVRRVPVRLVRWRIVVILCVSNRCLSWDAHTESQVLRMGYRHSRRYSLNIASRRVCGSQGHPLLMQQMMHRRA